MASPQVAAPEAKALFFKLIPLSVANFGQSVRSNSFRSSGFRWSKIGVWRGGKRRTDTTTACQALCFRNSSNVFSLLIVTLVTSSAAFYRVRNRDSERLSNLSKGTQPGRNRSGSPAPILMPLHHTAVASGPPTLFPGTAGSTVRVLRPPSLRLPLSPLSYWTSLLVFSSTSQQAVRATSRLCEGEARHHGATNRPGTHSPHDSKTELLG